MIAWHLLSIGETYQDLRGDYFEKRRSLDAQQKRLVARLEALGNKVTRDQPSDSHPWPPHNPKTNVGATPRHRSRAHTTSSTLKMIHTSAGALGAQYRRLIEYADEAHFSAVTPWELRSKRALGKLEMPDGLAAALQSGGSISLTISADHAERAPELPVHHRDPFDRILVAQAQLEALALVTADQLLGVYDIELVDARH